MATGNPNVILRAEATALGLARYAPQLPCKRGHLSERYTRGNACIECLTLKATAWIAGNRDRVRSIKQKHASKPSAIQRAKERHHLWHAENKETARQRTRNYRAKNPDKVRAFPSAKSPKKVAYRQTHREKQSAYHKQWKVDNPERVKANHWKREARKRGNGGIHTGVDIKAIFQAQRGKCAYCRIKLGKRYHVDHIVPLISGGTNDRRNIQITCPSCNLRKNAKDPIDYARSRGMLL